MIDSLIITCIVQPNLLTLHRDNKHIHAIIYFIVPSIVYNYSLLYSATLASIQIKKELFQVYFETAL